MVNLDIAILKSNSKSTKHIHSFLVPKLLLYCKRKIKLIKNKSNKVKTFKIDLYEDISFFDIVEFINMAEKEEVGEITILIGSDNKTIGIFGVGL